MIDQDTLQAIGQLLEAQDKRTDAKLEALLQMMDTKLSAAEQRIMKGTVTLMDAEFGPKFNLLAEELGAIREALPDPETQEVIDTRLAAVEAVVKKHSREIAELKRAN